MLRWLTLGLGFVALATAAAVGCGEAFSSTPTSTGVGATGGGGSGTTSSSAGGAATTTGTGAAGGGGNENCTNGADDDGDELVDCADSDCDSGFQCLDVPGDWEPAALLTSDSSSCAELSLAELVVGGRDPNGGELACSCECGAATGAACAQTTLVRVYGDSSCASGLLGSSNVGTTCVSIGVDAGAITGVRFEALAATGGSCESEQVVEDGRPEPGFDSPATVCVVGAVGHGCGEEQRCVPNGAPPCFVKQGDVVCPDGLSKQLIYGDYDDRRACACSCTPGSTCHGAVSLYTGASCGTWAATVDSPECSSTNVMSSIGSAQLAVAQPLCGSENVGTDGSVVGIEPYTVCCP